MGRSLLWQEIGGGRELLVMHYMPARIFLPSHATE